MRKAVALPLVLAALLAGAAACKGPKSGTPEIGMQFGTYKSALCEIENPREQFSIDEGMSMVVSSDRPFGLDQRYTLYLSSLIEDRGQTVREEIDRIILDVDPAQSVFCAAGPKLTPKQFGIKTPGRYRIEFWLGEERMAGQDLVITAATQKG